MIRPRPTRGMLGQTRQRGEARVREEPAATWEAAEAADRPGAQGIPPEGGVECAEIRFGPPCRPWPCRA
jgi:hypothetical protein